MTSFEKCVIFLNGFPGTGKLTIAKEIVKQSNFFLFDNHTVNNVLFSLFTPEQRNQLGDNQIWTERRKIYEIVFDVFLNHVPDENNYIFTASCLNEKKEAVEFFDYFKNFHTTKRNALFFPINLTCDQDELKKRVTNLERVNNHKLTDVSILENILDKHKLVNLDHPNEMTLDVTSITPQESAKVILQHLSTLYQKQKTL